MPNLYSGRTDFESRAEHRLTCLRSLQVCAVSYKWLFNTEVPKGEGKLPALFTEHHEAVLEEWRSRFTNSLTSVLDGRRWVVNITPRPLYPEGKSPWYSLDRRLGGLRSRSGHGGEETNSQPLPGLEPTIIQSVAQRYTTEQSRLTEEPKSNFIYT
jgi:hypothetical protein